MRGHAISIIDLTEETLDIIPDIKYLDKVVGLTVLWRQRGMCRDSGAHMWYERAAKKLKPV